MNTNSSPPSARRLASSSRLPSILRIALCATFLLGVGGASSEAHARGRVTAKANKQSQRTKVKQAKLKRRANRKAKPQRRLATLKLKRAKASKKLKATATLDAKVNGAIKSGSMASLMTQVKGVAVLNIGKFSKASRDKLLRAVGRGQTAEYKITFGAIPKTERVDFAMRAFKGYDIHPLTREAWAKAGTASSITVRPNVVTFGTGSRAVSYTNSPAGTSRTSIVNGSTVTRRSAMNPKTGKWTTSDS